MVLQAISDGCLHRLSELPAETAVKLEGLRTKVDKAIANYGKDYPEVKGVRSNITVGV